jgi:hypothetical protein
MPGTDTVFLTRSPIGSTRIDPDAPLYLGNPTGISAYADQQTDAANTYLLRLGDAAASLAPPVIEPEFPTGPTAPALTLPDAPDFEPVVWTAPNAPDVFTGTLTVDDLLPEPFEEEAPDLIFAAVPTFSETAPDAPPIDTSFEMPELSVSLPVAPALLSLNVVPFDGITLPTIDFEVPELEVAAPSIREYTPGEDYTSALLTALQTSLQERIEEGGTGINADVENAIWDRNREREARSAREALDKLDQMEAMGFALPPGAYADARLKIITESDYVDRGHSREVMIKSAELEQENVKTALTVATQLEGQLITYANSVEQRLFDSCKFATEAGIAIYNARVQAYAAYVDAYKARVNIYEAQIRAEIARVDAYRAQIAAEEAKANINRALVDSYRVQVDAAMSGVEIFKARIGAIQARAEIEKSKIEIFGEQVKAYAAKVGAYTAGVEGFRATVQAEGTKQEAYKSRVQAYSAQVDAGVKIIEARIATFKGNLDANVSAWEAYKSAYQAEAAKASAIATGNSSLAESYKATVAGTSSYNDSITKQWQVALDQAQRVTEIGVKAAEANGQLYMTTRSLALDAAKVGAQVSAQLGAAALNAINWSSSISTSTGWNNSTSYSNSSSDSESISTSYNYNYSV